MKKYSLEERLKYYVTRLEQTEFARSLANEVWKRELEFIEARINALTAEKTGTKESTSLLTNKIIKKAE